MAQVMTVWLSSAKSSLDTLSAGRQRSTVCVV